ncbi:NAD(P)/FAD-dependent oxidoreductase [Alloalcanivorax profundimaris]|uniref:NAD(P)/FAD-dependent oxidoreductase n=1 Tax=Alloalcanivorax profundimaris TaxID=2735259 RepID=UPI000C3D76BE|nr:FAD-dependent oxidoreductase [Alloalcanivorax profundimaris]MBF1802753.1 FAD-dependent oxidoreductase [Alloalcanivorax profundimaris]MBU57556.1 FAD-dependent oxidoreductase [Alcanivorax sp.]MCQ6263817.1 FAD-dependent oxidoreductase [Alcanivorax sp. MM125-6]UWN48657.1 Putative flavin-containing monoamine oxidase AofH [Alcanivorax sp. ALC70]
MSQRIAVVGAGISGLTAAWYLSRDHDVTVFEAEPELGGHTYTLDLRREHGDYAVDMGFIVFNDRTYPRFEALLAELGIGRQPTAMGFAVSDAANGLEYCGDGLAGFFGQRRNWVNRRHWRLLADILRFNREAPALLEREEGERPLGEYLRAHGYGEAFKRHYILPMGGAIWSCSLAQMEAFPARFFVRFFINHGLLALRNRPQWYVVPGGSRGYVRALRQRCAARFLTGTPVTSVRRREAGVTVSAGGEQHDFDQVILACHSDQALALLADPDRRERDCLSRLPYQSNDVVLHTDTGLLPRRRRVWSSWNALLGAGRDDEPVQVTYNMNILQGIQAPETFCVTLNAGERIDPARVLHRVRFDHPLFTLDGLAARETLLADNGARRTWFCGAWCRNGFHEDGVVSALDVVEALGGRP